MPMEFNGSFECTPEAEEFLCERLLDPSKPIPERFRALFSLRNLKGQRPREALVRATRDSSNLLAHEAAFALGQMQDSEAVPALEEVLKDLSVHPIVRHEAAEALGAIGPEGVVPLLRNTLIEDPTLEVQETCELALRRIMEQKNINNVDETSPIASPFQTVDPAIPASLDRSVDQLREVLLNEEEEIYERYAALFALRNQGDDACVGVIIESLGARSALLRHEVAYVLGQLQHKMAASALADIIRNVDEHPMVRHEAAEALGSIADSESIELLKEFANDPEPIVSQSCEVALSMLEFERAGMSFEAGVESSREGSRLRRMPTVLSTATVASFGGSTARVRVSGDGFPRFLPKEVESIRDPPARELAKRIQRLPVKISFSESSIMSSCVKPKQQNETEPVVLLHGFDSSCLEWRYAFPLLEDAGLETWAVDILGWGFSDLKMLPSSNVAAKREHLYQLWKSYIDRPMVLVGPSLGAAIAIDFTVNHPEAVARLVLIDASVYAKGTENLRKLPRVVAYAGVSLLKSIPLRFYANTLAFNKVSFGHLFDWTNIGRLHCLLPWWEDATVNFMVSGGYNVRQQIKQVKQKTLIIWGEDDQVVSSKLALRLHDELPNSVLHQIPNCGHLPHVEKPEVFANSILKFVRQYS